MDCDKFDRVLLDLLYDELDELTRAAAGRHCDQCARCRDILDRLSATRELSALPMVEPPDGFESRVMEAEARMRRSMPATQRLSRAVTILSGYAMRPQLAMAALLLLMIGSSLILLRPQPGSQASNMEVTESGVPLKEDLVVVPLPEEAVAPAPAQAPIPAEPESKLEAARAVAEKAPAAIAEQSNSAVGAEAELDLARAKAEDDAFDAAMGAYRSGELLTAQKRFDEIVQVGGKHASASELLAAQALEKAAGCSEALARFDSVAANNSGEVSNTATWHSADCRKQLGQHRRAILDFEKLLLVPAYAQQARLALSELESIAAAGPVLAEARKSKASARSVTPPANADGLGAGAPSSEKVAARRAAKPSQPPAAPPPAKAKPRAAGQAPAPKKTAESQ